jgi:hypothetical protein
MANQLTYDPTEYEESEFSEEELNSLQVGEELAVEQENLLAGKYRDAAELEQAYLELQKKFGSRETEQVDDAPEQDTEQVEEELPAGVDLIQQASEEFYTNGGQLSEETLNRFSEMSSRELVEAYMAMQANQPQQEAAPVADLTDREVNYIQNSVGGEQAYSQLVTWAAENLPDEYVQAFDSVVESGRVQAIQLAVAGLQREYEYAVGYEGRVLSGKAAAPQLDGFRSQAEVVRAMNDPRYENDPAYRQDIFDKLERSTIQF